MWLKSSFLYYENSCNTISRALKAVKYIVCQVRERCRREWTMFQDRMTSAEKAYFEAMGIEPPNSTAR